jgi:hypothetical protein
LLQLGTGLAGGGVAVDAFAANAEEIDEVAEAVGLVFELAEFDGDGDFAEG